jgi:peptide/nickel transport system ATP-binding protein
MEQPICELKAVSKDYAVRHSFFASSTYRIKALDRVNLSVKEGEILGLVGESGCGKSTLARIALGLESPTSGQVLFSGDDIADFDKTRLQNFRRQAQMVFQDPFSSLNPKKTVFKILSEPLKIHRLYSKNHYKEQVIRLLKEVGLDGQIMNRYPHEFSGGQRQRIGLARALATNPKMIVADEPTSALDVSIQAQIINLLLDLQERHRLSLLFISHDLPVIQFVSYRVAVMYKGQLIELMPKNAFLQSPNSHHPYTSLLLSAVPVPDPKMGLKAKRRDHILTCGHENHRYQNGCAFSLRCGLATDRCRTERPVWTKVAEDHFIACHFI